MTITKKENGTELVVALEGRLDATTAHELKEALNDSLDAAESLVLDLGGLEYISSAGLRLLLMAHTTMSEKGGMKLINVGGAVEDVLGVTGFADILNIE